MLEDPSDIEALIERRKRARPAKRRDQLAAMSDECRVYLQEVGRRRKSLEHEVRKLMMLVRHYGDEEVAAGMAKALGARQFGSRYVRFFIDQSRFARGLGELPEPVVTGNKKADDISVTPHNLETYDDLFERRETQASTEDKPPVESMEPKKPASSSPTAAIVRRAAEAFTPRCAP